MQIIAMLGRPGCGKSTAGRMVAEQLGYHYLSTGDIARVLRASITYTGDMAPEDQMREAVRGTVDLSRERGGIIIDGMPRVKEQVAFLQSLADDVQYFHVVVDREIASRRLLHRNRPDDTIPTIAKRMAVYDDNIFDIVRAVSAIGQTVRIVDGEESPRFIADRIISRIGGKK